MTVRLDGLRISTSEQLSALYRRRLRTHGFSARTMFYRDSTQHRHKLELFAEALQNCCPIRTMLDAGCGFGKLLEVHSPSAQYVGIDIVPEFVHEAKRRYPAYDFRLQSLFDDELADADAVVAAGVLSSVPNPDRFLARCLQLATTFAFFDVTLAERLPKEYSELNRWHLDDVYATVTASGFSVSESHDAGHSWVILVAERLPSQATR